MVVSWWEGEKRGWAWVGKVIVVSQIMGAAVASSFALVSLFNGKSVGSVFTGWCGQRPSGHCAGSGRETEASACSSSLVLWIFVFLSHLEVNREKNQSCYFFKCPPTTLQENHTDQCHVAVSLRLVREDQGFKPQLILSFKNWCKVRFLYQQLHL